MARYISNGDRARVYITLDPVSYEGWRILNEEGSPACDPESPVSEGDNGRTQRNTDDGASSTQRESMLGVALHEGDDAFL